MKLYILITFIICYHVLMEESLDELYNQFIESRKRKIRELIEVQNGMSIAEEVSHVKRAQNELESLLSETDSPMAATKISSEIRANAVFMMDVMGVGKEQLTAMNQSASTPVLPTQEAKQIGVIEDISFEEE